MARLDGSLYNESLAGDVTLTDSLLGVVGSRATLEDVDTSGESIGVSILETLRATTLHASRSCIRRLVSLRGSRFARILPSRVIALEMAHLRV
jgi:hypothetical protein